MIFTLCLCSVPIFISQDLYEYFLGYFRTAAHNVSTRSAITAARTPDTARKPSIFNKLTKHIPHAQMRQHPHLLSLLWLRSSQFLCITYICQASLLTDFGCDTHTDAEPAKQILTPSEGWRISKIKKAKNANTACENVIDVSFNIYKHMKKRMKSSVEHTRLLDTLEPTLFENLNKAIVYRYYVYIYYICFIVMVITSTTT